MKDWLKALLLLCLSIGAIIALFTIGAVVLLVFLGIAIISGLYFRLVHKGVIGQGPQQAYQQDDIIEAEYEVVEEEATRLESKEK